MKRFVQKYRAELLSFAIMFLLLVAMFSWFGPTYWLQLDDYIHYRELQPGTDVVQLCIDNGLFTSRPLAGLLDLAFWGRIPHYLGTLLLCAMYAGAAVLFRRLFGRLFGTSHAFLILFCLLPLGFEGGYWHAAATRILPPMFFTAVAVNCYDAFVREKHYAYLAAFLALTLLSFCFYEQMLVLSLALSLMLMCTYLLEKEWRGLWGLTVFLPVAGYAAITGYFSGLAEGQLASRMKLILPWDPEWLSSHMPRLMPQLKTSFGEAFRQILSRGFVRGVDIIFTEGIWLAALIPVAGVVVYVLIRRQKPVSRPKLVHLTPLFAALAFLAPITPFFVIADPWFSLRGILPSFLGLALAADYLLRMVTKDRTALAAALIVPVFLVCSVSELSDYRAVTLENQQVAEAILAADERYGLSGRVGILDLDHVYLEDQNFLYHDHVMSSHASDWALTGLVRYHARTPAISYTPTPLRVSGSEMRYGWSTLQGFTGEYPFVFRYDRDSNSLIFLTVTQVQDDRWELVDENGSLRACIRRDGDAYGYVELIDP